jgi:hypothetical protein
LNSWHAVDLAVNGDQILTTSAPIPIPATGATLAFSHDYDTESSWDGGVVEISTDQVIWSDLGPFALENPYNVTLNSSSNPLSGRPAYSGTGMGYLRSRFDLSSYGGSNVWIRFRMGSDSIVGGKGWWIDDVWIGELIPNEAWVDAGGAALAEARETVHVPEPTQVWMLFAGISALFVLSRRRFHS